MRRSIHQRSNGRCSWDCCGGRAIRRVQWKNTRARQLPVHLEEMQARAVIKREMLGNLGSNLREMITSAHIISDTPTDVRTTAGSHALSHQLGLEYSMVPPTSANDAGENISPESSCSPYGGISISGGMKRRSRPRSTQAPANMQTLRAT